MFLSSCQWQCLRGLYYLLIIWVVWCQNWALDPRLLLHLPFSLFWFDNAIATLISCLNPWPSSNSCPFPSSYLKYGKHDNWIPLLGSVISLECDILCSCHMGWHVIVLSSSSALCQWPWLLDTSMACCQLWWCASITQPTSQQYLPQSSWPTIFKLGMYSSENAPFKISCFFPSPHLWKFCICQPILRSIQKVDLVLHQLWSWSLPVDRSCIVEKWGDPWNCVESS